MKNTNHTASGGCVVLADSHQNMLEGIRGLLEAMFEAVVMVADKISLFKAIDRMEPDLLVVDLSLAVSEGENIVSELSKQYPQLKFIVLSLHDEQAAVDRIMSAGASGFVLKRSAGTDLPKAIDEVRQGRTYISPLPNRDE